MKIAGIITNANKDVNEETIIALFKAYSGVLTYRLNDTMFTVNFDANTIECDGICSEFFAWEPTIEDLDHHRLSFGLYIQGRV